MALDFSTFREMIESFIHLRHYVKARFHNLSCPDSNIADGNE